jgi:hypothetical protein
MDLVKVASIHAAKPLDGDMNLVDPKAGDSPPSGSSRVGDESVAAHVQHGNHQSLSRRGWGGSHLENPIGDRFEHARSYPAADRLVVNPCLVQLSARNR